MVLMKRWSIIRCRMSTLLLPTIYNGQQNIYKKYSSIWFQFKIVMSASYDTQREKN